MKHDERKFIAEVITKLDESARSLLAEEQRLAISIGDERVMELLRFWLKELPETEAEKLRLSLNHDEKKLTWIWLRLKHLYQSRAKANLELTI